MKPIQGDRGEVHSAKNGKVFQFLFRNVFLMAILLWPLTQTFAQSEQAPVLSTELEIGDTLPDEVWDLPLQIVNHPEGKEIITLNDYKGKLIVLDFWATWCKPCLKNIPHLFDLQKRFKDEVVVLMVTIEKKATVADFISTTKSPDIVPVKDRLYSIVEGENLHRLFPHQTVPHTVVIDGNGIVKAITLPQLLSEEMVQKAVSFDPDFAVPVKEEKALEETMLKYNYTGTHAPLYYSAIMGHTPGFDSYTAWEVDSLNNYVRLYAKSQPILRLYLPCAHPRDFNFSDPNRRILLVKDPSKYYYHYDRDGNYTVYDTDWIRKNHFSYEAILPLSFSKDMIRQKMKREIDAFFGLRGSIEKRTMTCLVLKRLPGSNAVYMKERKESTGKNTRFFHSNTAFGFAYTLNNLRGQPLPLVLNETGYEGPLYLELPKDLRNIDELRDKLREQGLDLVQEKKEVGMFVLRQEGYEPSVEDLVLTQYGYIPAELVSKLPPSPSIVSDH